jgi:2-C-methyl-D-erythritol 4-phosphate cytidylyltransferase / 2-C-methyl-D-erythritol 2,4-cyclodiphosphate synthase
MWVSAILAAGGRGARMGAAVPKQMLMIGNRSILQRSFDTLASLDEIAEIIVALPADLVASPPAFLTSSARTRVKIVDGGATRHESVANGFARIEAERTDYVTIHDAARPFATPRLFAQVMEAARHSGAAIAAVRARDTVKLVAADDRAGGVITDTLSRDSIYLAQTPQTFRYGVLGKAIELGRLDGDATDESTLVERTGHRVTVVDGEPANIKITTEQDLRVAEALVGESTRISTAPSSGLRIGVGYDLHRLERGRPLILGGVVIPHETGLSGHSDADVLCHAVTDAILGAASEGDIGRHFSDTDPRWKDANSLELLSSAVQIVRDAGFTVVNVDAVVIAERPKLAPHIDAIRARLAAAIGIAVGAVSVKGKTNETVGALGRNEAIAVHAVAMLARGSQP